MSEQDTSSRDLLAPLRAAPISVRSPDEVTHERKRILPWLEERVRALPAARQRARHRKRMVSVGGVAIAAAAVCFAVWGLRPWKYFRSEPGAAGEATDAAAPLHEFATLVSGRVDSGSLEVLPGSRIGLSSRVRTGEDERATLRASAGYDVTLSANTEIAFLPERPVEDHRELSLRMTGGEISLAVPKLAPERSLAVRTPDATVRVIGTRFLVRLEDDGAEVSTCVRVEEGRVEVIRAGGGREVLDPGQSSGCRPVARDDIGSRPIAPEVRPPKDRRGSTPSGTLGKQNELLSTALAAERRGDFERAERNFRELLRRHPDSPFAPDARAGLRRIENR